MYIIKNIFIFLIISYLFFYKSAYAYDYRKLLEKDNFEQLNHPSVLKKTQCLGGVFGNYQNWKNKLVARGKITHTEFERRLSEQEYNFFKSNVECASIIYQVKDYHVRGFVLYPKKQQLANLPAIIFNRGGSDLQKHSLKVGDLFLLPYQLASAGHVVIASQYGGAQVWPENKKVGIGVDEFGGAELQDVLALLPILKSMRMVNINRLGMVGWSRGSMMSLLALKQGANIKSMVIGGSLVDVAATAKERPEFEEQVLKRLIPSYSDTREAALKERSAIRWHETLPIIPILMLHGQSDEFVSVKHAKRYYLLASQHNRLMKYVEYPNGSHTLREHNKEVQMTIVKWFAETL